jgi:tripartite-type tricarboxylate transporter receptor subunit TctC
VSGGGRFRVGEGGAGRRSLLRAAAAAPLLAAGAARPAAAAWAPDRPVRLVVPFPPGGPTDIVARLLAQKLAGPLGQPVVVENRGGAGGNLGAEHVAKAPPDGHALLLATVGVMAINPALYARLPYDAATDLAPVALVAAAPVALVAHPSLPARTVAELVELAKARPRQVVFGSAGNGTPGHLAGEIFNGLTGAGLTHAGYRGSGPAIQDLVGGQIPLAFDPVQSVLPHIEAGRVLALAISNPSRIPALPGVPTMAEAGVPGHETTAWWAVAAPARTPEPVLAALAGAVRRVAEAEEWRSQLSRLGIDPVVRTGPDLVAFIRAEAAKWGEAVRASGARAD